MVVAFYPVTHADYNMLTSQPELNVDYNSPIEIKEMDFIPGIKSIIELKDDLYSIHGAEIVRYDNNGKETIFYACHVDFANNHPTRTIGYTQEFDKMLTIALRKIKIKGLLD